MKLILLKINISIFLTKTLFIIKYNYGYQKNKVGNVATEMQT